ncbi:uncharacterized protein BKA78DRAFT_295171 [Phyllosticta capitalensis]|uniref:Uncharacterized protein n=1 Tax=Phyllosticta capitalensis TaxID=121624 RepID=A0ABR1YP54_9PEZI
MPQEPPLEAMAVSEDHLRRDIKLVKRAEPRLRVSTGGAAVEYRKPQFGLGNDGLQASFGRMARIQVLIVSGDMTVSKEGCGAALQRVSWVAGATDCKRYLRMLVIRMRSCRVPLLKLTELVEASGDFPESLIAATAGQSSRIHRIRTRSLRKLLNVVCKDPALVDGVSKKQMEIWSSASSFGAQNALVFDAKQRLAGRARCQQSDTHDKRLRQSRRNWSIQKVVYKV